MKTLKTQTEKGTRRHVSFGINDAKGREIGLSIIVAPVTVTEAPADSKMYYTCFDEVGEYIGVRMNATRNGIEFGASQQADYFKTQQEADAAIAKRVESTRARYAKQFSQA